MEPSLEERLGVAGLRPAAANGEVSIDLLVYDTPDAVLSLWRQRGQPAPGTQALAKDYRRLSQLRSGTRLISAWRLRQLNADELLAWLHGQADCPTLDTPPPAMDALSAVVTRRLLELQSDALEAYLDLELQAELAGTRPDSNYIARLDDNADGATLLEDWWQVAEQAATANRLAGEVADLKGEKDVLTHEKNAAVQGADELSQQLASQAESLLEVQEDNKSTLLQFHQIQEELESYCLKNHEQDQQLQKLEGQLTELRREQAAISQDRDAALEASADLKQQLATQCAEAARWKDKAETASQQHTAARQQAIDLEQQLASQAESLLQVQAENKSTLLQLHQVQEELESYFLKNREQDDQLQKLEGQLTELRREQAATSQARDAALEASADLKQQLATQRDALHLAQAKGEQQAGHLQVLEAEAARWKDKAETASQQHTDARQQAIDLEQQLASQAESLLEVQEDNKSTLLQFHQIQEELESYFLKNREQDDQLQKLEAQQTQLRREQAAISQDRDAALEASADLKQQLATQRDALHLAQAKGEQQAGQLQALEVEAARWKDKAETASQQHTDARQQAIDLEQQLASQAESLLQVQAENKSTLLQLHQVQEELEHYFLRASAGDKLCQAQAQENTRAMGLLGRMIRLQAGL
ncbi:MULTISPECIES: hypothetical protein [unclassified Cyanobium]|uniref:hypothetical protein n=1 Tax=unclassified Cyanobium TaxID=2627006 RepID=UPI0020CC8EF3|nr:MULTISPECIES: hypothetical protein [unclassified Cyanobium]MCP9859671.1 hypothetical protein [Cyanobium sp. Cruz-8H5]MCP9866790.1 hypothetical protein [Cyanobium sp. Cruz-8D1]